MLGSPVFDPYQRGQGVGNVRPLLPGTPPPASYGGSLFPGLAPAATAGFPAAPPPTAYPPAYGTAPGMPPATVYPPEAYPNAAPSTLFPGGVFNGPSGGGYLGGISAGLPEPLRLIQGPRLRHTWLAGGDDPRDLEINDTDVSVAIAFPSFLYSGQPLYVLPSFSLHMWDGPDGAIGADLPAQAYSAFLDSGWQSDPMQMAGLELGLRVGVFSDFETFNSDSLRVMGKALGIFRLSPTTTLKAGAMYVDRNDLKVIPAGGLLWQPTPYKRYDIFFPNPKFSHFHRTFGTYDTWWYLAGEYGGGAWTITRTDGTEDSIDINDLRVLLGLEWGRSDLIRAGKRTGFVEIGYVFDREVEYLSDPADNFDPNDTFLIRAGIGY